MICLVTGRGYGYVAVSRFKRRGGVYLYGKLRRTDFLPVGEDVLTYLLTYLPIYFLTY